MLVFAWNTKRTVLTIDKRIKNLKIILLNHKIVTVAFLLIVTCCMLEQSIIVLYCIVLYSDWWKLRLMSHHRRKRLNHAIWSTAFHSKNFCKILPSSQYFLHLVKLNSYQYKLLKLVVEAKFYVQVLKLTVSSAVRRSCLIALWRFLICRSCGVWC